MIKDVIARNINALMEERGISRYELSNLCPDIARQSIYNATDGNKGSTIETLESISRGLEVPLQALFEDDNDQEYNLTTRERDLIDMYRQMNKKQCERLIGYAVALAEEKK